MDEKARQRLETRLDNWGAWARGTVGGEGSCASAERGYVAPRDDDGERLKASVGKDPIDVADAELLERCILRLRAHAREILVLKYAEQAHVTALSEVLHLAPRLVMPRIISIQDALQHVLNHVPNQILAERRMRRGLHPSNGSNMYQEDG